MVKKDELVVWLKNLESDDEYLVGAKAANLGEMILSKFPVPEGFVVTALAFENFIQHNKLRLKIKHLLNTVNYEDPHSLTYVSNIIKRLVVNAEIPDSITKKVFERYHEMGKIASSKNMLVAIRSSSIPEDSKVASFAGQEDSFLNVKGDANVIEKIKKCWASLYEPRALYYRYIEKIDQSNTRSALIIQRMVESDISGVMFTVDPVTNDKSKIIIEAIYGLGEYIVQGRVTPDHYEVNKKTLDIIKKTPEKQTIMLKRVGAENREVKVPENLLGRSKIEDSTIIFLSKLASDIENHYYFPQDIEWAIEGDSVYIVQTRPITTTHKVDDNTIKGKISGFEASHHRTMLVRGESASPGIAIGVSRVLKSPHELYKLKQGEILVTPYTNPDYVAGIKRAAAVIAEEGGKTSHASIVAREFGIPAVVGVHNATKIIHDGMILTVNGKAGIVYKGSLKIRSKTKEDQEPLAYPTKTKILLNILANQSKVLDSTVRKVDGVGVLSSDPFLKEIGYHPKKIIKERRAKFFVHELSEKIKAICLKFYPRPVILRASNLASDELRSLKGGSEFEEIEINPMLGYRGALRLQQEEGAFHLELQSVKEVRVTHNLTNLHLAVPFIRTLDELINIKKILSQVGVHRSSSFKLFAEIATPSSVVTLDEIIKTGIDGVIINSENLTSFMLAIDPSNHQAQRLINIQDPSVLWAIERTIRTCKKYHIESILIHSGFSHFQIEKAVEWGVDGVSAEANAIDQVRNIIHQEEIQKNGYSTHVV